MSRYETASTIINDTALEVGLTPVSDPFSSQDEAYVQLVGLLTVAGRELAQLEDWQELQQTFNLNTTNSQHDGSLYDLPDDYSHMIDQTGWNRTANLPLAGPTSVQTWSTLVGRDLSSTTLYASFRLSEGKVLLYPDPPPEDTDISFQYQSRNWVEESGGQRSDRVINGTDTPLYSPILIQKLLKLKYLSAKGDDIMAASREFDLMMGSIKGKNKGAPVLNTAGGNLGYPYISPYRNTGDTRYGI
jgi:hypothetical protein